MKEKVEFAKDPLFMALFNQVVMFNGNFQETNTDINYISKEYSYIVNITSNLISRRNVLIHSKLSKSVTEVELVYPSNYESVMYQVDKFESKMSAFFS